MNLLLLGLIVFVAAIAFLVLISRTRAGRENLEAAVHSSPTKGENDPAERREDTAEMVDAVNQHRAEHGEPKIDQERAQTEQVKAEVDDLPAQAAHYEEVLQDDVDRFHVSEEDLPVSVEEGAREAAEERMRPGDGP